FQYFTFTLLQEGAVLYAGYRVLVSGTMVFAQMAVIQTTMNSNSWTLIGFADSVMTIVKNSLYLEQTRHFLEYEPAIPEDQEGLLPELPIRSVEFEHVSFGYKEGAYALKDISFKIEGNQSIALAGYNGAGKSTMMKLLMRLYDPSEGRILVNGIDIREYQVRAYRDLFSAAFQNGRIFANTIEENILMGRHTEEEKDCEKVLRALKLADIYEEVENQPLQEKTILTREFSKEGVVLSGGQNQKILAARAFAKDSPIAVFDEPSSALDPLAEHHLFENIREYGKDKILFFISHRLSSVRDANLVFYMKNGRIQERGSHVELMSRNGEYASLYRLQAENYQGSCEK
ncbi:MAG: ABC transporter ATP-binding protein/permease, partial [Lachnospiraceae bacterium]|nr:ABC transporter ATP-binding protein/permease [Lachnospiraceae bacterium]